MICCCWSGCVSTCANSGCVAEGDCTLCSCTDINCCCFCGDCDRDFGCGCACCCDCFFSRLSCFDFDFVFDTFVIPGTTKEQSGGQLHERCSREQCPHLGWTSLQRTFLRLSLLEVRARNFFSFFFFHRRIVLQLDVVLTDMSGTPFASSPHGGVAQGHAAAIDETWRSNPNRVRCIW